MVANLSAWGMNAQISGSLPMDLMHQLANGPSLYACMASQQTTWTHEPDVVHSSWPSNMQLLTVTGNTMLQPSSL